MFKIIPDNKPWQPMDHPSPSTGETTPSSTPEVKGEIGGAALLPGWTLSELDHSPSESSRVSPPRSSPISLLQKEPSTTKVQQLSLSEDTSSLRRTPYLFSPNPPLLSRSLYTPETKQPDSELIDWLSLIGGPDWSAEKEQWVKQVLRQTTEGLPRISILDQLKIQKNKGNIRIFVKEQLDQAKAAQSLLESPQQKKEALSSLLNKSGEIDYIKTIEECLISACCAENFIGDRGAIDYYHQHKSVLMLYCKPTVVAKLDLVNQRVNRVHTEDLTLVNLSALSTQQKSRTKKIKTTTLTQKFTTQQTENHCCCVVS